MASRRSGPCGAGLPLASLRFSPPHKSPTPDTAHRAAPLRCSSTNTTAVPAKPRVGVRRQRHCAALRSGGLVAARALRALQHLTRRDCSSAANEVSVASFAAGHETEHRKGVGAKRTTPHTSAGAYPPAALLAQSMRRGVRLMSGLGGLNKSTQRCGRRPCAASAASGRDTGTPQSSNQAHLRPRRQGAAQPEHDGPRRVPRVRTARAVDEHGAGADGVARRARGCRVQGGLRRTQDLGLLLDHGEEPVAAIRTTAG